MKWGPISKEQEDEVEWVRAQLSETERECQNLVTQKNLLESGLLQGSKYLGHIYWVSSEPFVVVTNVVVLFVLFCFDSGGYYKREHEGGSGY